MPIGKPVNFPMKIGILMQSEDFIGGSSADSRVLDSGVLANSLPVL